MNEARYREAEQTLGPNLDDAQPSYEAAVTVVLILSICTLLYAFAAGHGVVAFRASALA
jgi:hypothetical protein